ncbi:MAG: Cobalt-zinc-cadmium resistance protein [uncultured Campylobacterales bacterium]|uniref:Cobalt-zinc-cadmium resistance protein n=1 Tax=uncultured Campylobacterales bacterium TaxID=352960 RepID=A0A6S6SRE2_9BACT|nr:MAG: Cobalt-zinc-cadmium resistance protein [uncultured Campylobacterales bacterium]
MIKSDNIPSKATIVSSSVAFILIIIKLTFGIFSGSVALLASAIDSVLDFFVSLFNYFAIKKSVENPDKIFNYGKGKLESLAAFVEGIVIVLSGLYVLYISITKVFNPEELKHLNIAIIVMSISVVITFCLVLYLNSIYKKTKNILIKTDALHYKMDLYTNIAILISLFIVNIFGFVLVDAVLGICIGIYIIYEATKLIKESSLILLDHSLDREMVLKIREIFKSHDELIDFHALATRTSGVMNFVNVDVVFQDTDILLIDAHKVSDEIEESIKNLDKTIKWKINIHLDPYDDED